MDLQPSSARSLEREVSSAETRDADVASVQPSYRAVWATRAALAAILLIGLYFRTLSLTDWDAGTGQHPDERFFTDVSSSVHLPAGLGEYFDSARSPVNPRNYEQFPLFVYGPFPMMLTRLTAVLLTPPEALPETVPSITGPPNPRTSTGPPIDNPERALPRLTLLMPLFNPDGVNLTTYGDIVKVGRSLAVLFDLGSILLVYLIAQRLFDRRVGLLAALFTALTVMQIQQAHFFVDPIFSTFFVLLALYWAVRAAQTGGVFSFAMLGVSIGIGMANRITLATLGLTAIVAAAIWALGGRKSDDDDASFVSRFTQRGFPLLAMAGVLTLLTFRIFQPDAFIGSRPDSPPPGIDPVGLTMMHGWGFFDLRLDPRFIENLGTVRSLVTGEYDYPPSQQWVQRPAYWFPWKNLMLWGMGPALGLAAWSGWIAAAWAMRRWRRAWRQGAAGSFAALILWIWVGFYFAWQGGQFAITMRYLLPIYGALTIFAAWLLVRMWEWANEVAARRARTPIRAVQQFVARGALVLVVIVTLGWAYAFSRIYDQPHSRVIAARWLLDHAPAGSRIASERWDDPLPLQVDGINPWGSIYQGVGMAPYAEDEERKYFGAYNSSGQYESGLLDQLEEADYITLTSNRVYGSTVRLPMRYPALMRYYHYLFAGELGFELVADITSYPSILGIDIPDQSAEEAFTVYDHPRVLIFKKTADFSRQRAAELITSDVNWDEVYKLPVHVADRTATALRLTTSQWPDYRAAGTWSRLFDPQSLSNRFAPLVWLIVLEALGLAGFALLFHVLPGLPDRGFALARVLALLLVAYAAWLLGSLHLAPFTPATLWLCATPLLVAGAWVGWRSRKELLAFWRARRGALLTAEAIFLAFFALGLLLRWFNPDLWHPGRGGEKPMDFAYLNAVLKSAAFPPYDPWYAGGYINYYYFGFVIVGALIHLTNIAPSVAYNLAVPTLFALTALGAWGVAYNLLAPRVVAQRAAEWRARCAGLLAPVFVLLLGSLTQAIWFVDGYAAAQAQRPEWAFWDATRIIPGTVNEFPFFTFLFADLHAHMIVMPFALALLGLNVVLARGSRLWASRRARDLLPSVVVLLLLGLLAGALRAANTWDYPTYVALTAATIGLVAWRGRASGLFRRILAFGGQVAAVVVIGNILFLPFTSNFATESSGAELLREGLAPTLLEQVWLAQRTALWDLLRIHGLWIFLIGSAGILLMGRFAGARYRVPVYGALAGGLALLALVGAAREWTALTLLTPLVIGAAALAWRMRRMPPRVLLPLLWAGAALGLSLLVEVVVVKGDVGRMNTVFKFGLHAWILFALAAAATLPWMWTWFARRAAPVVRYAWSGAVGLLIVAALAYPLTATPARLADRYAADLPNTLDGAAFMHYVDGNENGVDFPLAEDASGIAWLQSHVTGTPIIVEAHLPSYRWAGRVATYTGLPTLLGWEWHQIQQRNAVNAQPVIARRQAMIGEIFNSTDTVRKLKLLDDYGVEYVYVGGVERAVYAADGLAAFDTLAQSGALEVAFSESATRIYRVVEPGAPTMLTSDLAVQPPHADTLPALMLDRPVNELPAVNEYTWNGWASANSWTAALVWLTAIYGLGLLGLPLAITIFGHWRDGGVIWARVIGLLLFGYAVWLPVSLGILRYDRWGVFIGFILMLALNVWLTALIAIRRQRQEGDLEARRSLLDTLGQGVRLIGAHLRNRGRAALIGEGVFLIGFALFTLLRAFNPDLWHPTWGGEKPMEFGFLNAILRSPVMPPYDPFFSGGYVNYYYYGFFLVSLPIKITGIDPALAYNLVIPTLAGVTLAGAYGLVARLTGRVRYGLLGAAFLALLGNLAGVIPIGWSRGVGPVIDALAQGGLTGMGERLGDWYVGPSRVIANTINEFPFWSFLFADLHPHLIALPVSLLAIALALQIVERRATTGGDGWGVDHLPAVLGYLLIALTLGALAVTNSWDFPTYALVFGAASLGAAWRTAGERGIPWAALLRAALLALVVTVGALALYTPFFDRFHAFVGGIGLVNAGTTPTEYLIVYGLFLAILLPVSFGAFWRVIARRQSARLAGQTMIVIIGMLGAAAIVAPAQSLRLWLGALLLIGIMLLLQRRIRTETWFVLLLAMLGWAVSIGIEVIFVRDHLVDNDWWRMNTVFKFGVQIWTLLSLAAAASLPQLLRALRRDSRMPIIAALRPAYGLALAALVALAAVFPLAGTPSRLANRFPVDLPPTLDGLAFLRETDFDYSCQAFGGCAADVEQINIDLRGDAQAIDWLNRNIEGTPIVAQSNLGFYRGYGVRIAANTGLPTIVSALHVNEQRDPFLAGVRDRDVETLFNTADIETALHLLAKYRVDYVYIGGVERALYNADGLDKFTQLNGSYLDVVYDTPDVQIYRVRDIPRQYALEAPAEFTAITPPEPPTPDSAIPAGLEEMEQALSADPTDSSLAFGLAESYRAMGRLEDAARVLKIAAQANPDDIGLHHLWGDILTEAGRYDEAEQAYTQAAQVSSTAGNWNKLGVALLGWGELDKAEIALTKALAIDAGAPEPYFFLGRLYAQRGQYDQAIAALETCLALAPDGYLGPEARELLAQIQAARN